MDRVIAALREAGVAHLVDVRAVPSSRKPGFSRRQLEAAVLEAGMQYTHLRALGTPKPGRDAARRGDAADHAPHLRRPSRRPRAAGRTRACGGDQPRGPLLPALLRARPPPCHRDILAGLIEGRTRAKVTHLLAEAVYEHHRCRNSSIIASERSNRSRPEYSGDQPLTFGFAWQMT